MSKLWKMVFGQLRPYQNCILHHHGLVQGWSIFLMSIYWHGYCHRRRPSSGHPSFNRAHPKELSCPSCSSASPSPPGSTPLLESCSLSFLCSKNSDQGLHTTIGRIPGAYLHNPWRKWIVSRWTFLNFLAETLENRIKL
jgi:hypothetical protein